MSTMQHLIECFLVSDENGAVEKYGFLNMQDGSRFLLLCPKIPFFLPTTRTVGKNLKIFFMTPTKDPNDILSYLRGIKPGRIVLVASFDDVTPK